VAGGLSAVARNYALKKPGFTPEGTGWVEAHFSGRAAEPGAFIADLQKGGADLVDYFKNCGTPDIFAGRARAWNLMRQAGTDLWSNTIALRKINALG
jgi:hypothetical protein